MRPRSFDDRALELFVAAGGQRPKEDCLMEAAQAEPIAERHRLQLTPPKVEKF